MNLINRKATTVTEAAKPTATRVLELEESNTQIRKVIEAFAHDQTQLRDADRALHARLDVQSSEIAEIKTLLINLNGKLSRLLGEDPQTQT